MTKLDCWLHLASLVFTLRALVVPAIVSLVVCCLLQCAHTAWWLGEAQSHAIDKLLFSAFLSPLLFLVFTVLRHRRSLLHFKLCHIEVFCKMSGMVSEQSTGPMSPLSPSSFGNEKRAYQYEEVALDDRFSKATIVDQVRLFIRIPNGLHAERYRLHVSRTS